MTMPVVARKPVEIFISYSRKDRHYLEELHKQLKVYDREKPDGPDKVIEFRP